MLPASGSQAGQRVSPNHRSAIVSPEIQSSLPRTSGAEEINRLHADAVTLSTESRNALQAALIAAWKAGQLLAVEKRNVRRTMGPGAWQLWLERHFSGTPRTAERYMLLAKQVRMCSETSTGSK